MSGKATTSVDLVANRLYSKLQIKKIEQQEQRLEFTHIREGSNAMAITALT
jgi:DNA-binding protein